ncbi:hypothetical protein BGAL_0169g00240 [Botrytis galanthina]|uniref:Heterokaryon incompatibility domain-containing protein n=1 Tax=Botrytis galanthina TaxID=278940 RepID=A0A4S8R0J0_9HELO|nr:hypothetical protein BGAL_0169g00240 [Botrytis galanthina]
MGGAVTVNESVMLNGAEFHDTLHCSRKLGMQSQFWVYAICINQNDIPERNKQLMTMERIYLRAEFVAAWLGRKYERFEQVPRARNDRVVFGNIHTEGLQKSDVAPETIVRLEEILESLVAGPKENANNEKPGTVKELYTDGYCNRL